MLRLAYVVTPKEPANGLMEVELEVFTTDQEMPKVFKIGEKSWRYEGPDDPVVAFEASNASDQSLASTKLDVHHWQIETGFIDSLKLHYTVQLPNRYVGHNDSFMESSRVHILARQVFIVPKDIQSTNVTVQFKTPPDWKIITLWERKDNRYIPRDTEHLVRSWLALGDYIVSRTSADKAQITVAVNTELKCTPGGLAEFIRNVLVEQAKVFDAQIEGNKLFIFNRGNRGWGGTSDNRGGWSLSLTSNETDETFLSPKISSMGPVLLMSHEFFHNWSMHIGYPEGPQPFWFTEGFTEFYGLVTLYRMKVLSQADFHQFLRQANETLVREKIQEIPLDGSSKPFGKKEWASTISYRKGMLFAFLLDVEIRQSTNGKQNLDAFMQKMSDEFGDHKRGYRYEDMVRLLNDITSQDMSHLFEDYVYGTKVINIEELL